MISVIIPMYNGAGVIEGTLATLKKSPDVSEILVIDAGSTDKSVKIATSYGATVLETEKRSFDHGGSRTLGGKKAEGNILVYMTQDAVLADARSIERLVRPLRDNEEIGAVYGRQLPHNDATLFAAHLRAFNYPSASDVKSLKDSDNLRIKAPFMSNSFAAYKRSTLERVGWFKEGIIMAEDVYAAAKLLKAGYKIAYVADALCNHSHNYNLVDEFKRYFDIGVFHKMESWILKEFGKAEGEGARYLKSELRYLLSNRAYHLIPVSFLRTALKYLGYKMGNNYERLPKALVRRLSMHADFWSKPLRNGKED